MEIAACTNAGGCVLFIYLLSFQTLWGFNEHFRWQPVSFYSQIIIIMKNKKTSHQASGLEYDGVPKTSSVTKLCDVIFYYAAV